MKYKKEEVRIFRVIIAFNVIWKGKKRFAKVFDSKIKLSFFSQPDRRKKMCSGTFAQRQKCSGTFSRGMTRLWTKNPGKTLGVDSNILVSEESFPFCTYLSKLLKK